jgi:hypothetical protein
LTLTRADVFDSGYNLTIPNVSVYHEDGPVVIRAAILGLGGLYHSMALSTISVSTTVGKSTSNEYVYSGSSGKGPSCIFPSES